MFKKKFDPDGDAKRIIQSNEIGLQEVKELLIYSAHSSKIAKNFFEMKINDNDLRLLKNLIIIAGDMDDFGDSPLESSFYIKDFSDNLLIRFEREISEAFLNDDRCARTFLSIALGKIKSDKTKEIIYNLSKDEDCVGNWILKDAVDFYEKKV